ncbi:MAG: methionyl-tRNA formyltransferase [Candidatus Paracaedibacteraceae bacterium]|nr:methionyl-tRNA formyltransferase [Candidatus Paracaedibacteraceae bacterium]
MSLSILAPKRLIFMGTPEFSVAALKVLIDSGHDVVAVYTRPPKARDRGQTVQKTPVHVCADEHNIPVYTPKSLRNETEQAFFKSLNADLAVVAAYGLILPIEILDAPRLGCVNIHASLLPRWRGAAPIQRAIMAEDSETGVTLMQIDVGLDTGAMLVKSHIAVSTETTASSLHDQLMESGAMLLRDSLEGLLLQTIQSEVQPEEGIMYAAKLEKLEGELDWNQSATALHARIRALNPWPGTWFTLNNAVIKVLTAEVIDIEAFFTPGTFFENEHHALCVACGQGALSFKVMQRAGGKPLEVEAFLRGFPIEKCRM